MNINVFDNIYLQPMQSSDAVDIFNTINSQREYLGRWLPFVSITDSLEFTQGFVDSVVNVPLENFTPTFTIRVDGAFAGIIGLKETDLTNHKTEIGYWLSEPFQGKGIMSGAVNRLCEYAFIELAINRIQIKCAVGNQPSSNIPKRLGFRLEGVERCGELFPDGNYADLEIYSLLRSEF